MSRIVEGGGEEARLESSGEIGGGEEGIGPRRTPQVGRFVLLFNLSGKV